LNKQLGGRCHFGFFFQSANNLVCPSLGDVKSFKNFDNFKTLIRKWPKLLNPFDLAQTYTN